MSNETQNKKLWGGRFSEATDAFVEAFTASVDFDQRLYAQDIAGSKAHAGMLARAKIISKNECQSIIQGLDEIQQEIEAGQFNWSVALEDVHMNIEARLTEKIGEAGKKLHTGRSRNDQVATDIRLYLRQMIDLALAELKRLQQGLLSLAQQHTQTVMPGFTHLQVAQPVCFAHHVMAWFEMFERDVQRLLDVRKRVNVLPLGAAALAGTTYAIDREYVAKELGFAAVSENSLDAVSDRDFAIEFCAAAALCMTHLSRQSEELIIWSSQQFGFIDLPDRFCTGSSIMPQKKNPDVPELVRGKSGRVNGDLIALLTLMKAQPLAYNKDNQEDKEPLFDAVDTLLGCLRAFADMVPALKVNADAMRAAVSKGYATATDLADYLVKKGIAFRDAHEIVGNAVAWCEKESKDLSEAPLSVLQEFSSAIEKDVFNVLSLEGSLAARDHIGGTAPRQVLAAIERAKKSVAQR
ncbi:MAG: argininosuccinate lyase [Gammaproteobacteria bacterium]|nr:argininosuccinate lyase [Gammaproteobacteria bacterium]